MIPRIQHQHLLESIRSNKLLFVFGPRHIGKRTSINAVFHELNIEPAWIDCSDKKTRKLIQDHPERLKNAPEFVVLHDAQILGNLQSILEKVLDGTFKSSFVISCSFVPHIDPILMEALEAENLIVQMFAPSFNESAKHFGLVEEERLLEERLIYGNYPEVLANLSLAEATLNKIIEDAIFTQLSGSDRINKSEELMRLLRQLAFRIGETVSYHDLGQRCGLDNETVERYISLLEDAFILIRLTSFSTGKRYELLKSNMVYFTDNGVRNALIQNFNSTDLRNDMPELWSNYLISERLKWLKMNNSTIQSYFWKTHTRQQMDLVELSNGSMIAWKTDWEKRKKIKFPKSFIEAYPNAKTKVLNRSTYWSFLTEKLGE